MKRYANEQWCDFVRGLASPEDQTAMKEQLASGDAPEELVNALNRVAEVGLKDHEVSVPTHAVRLAKVLASVERCENAPTTPRWLPMDVSFDSFLQPSTVGTRDLGNSHRQVSFKADGYSVDVRLESETPQPGRVVVGQILSMEPHDGQGDADPVSRASVFAFSGDTIVGKALSGTYGEFQLEDLPADSLALCVVAGEDFLELPLQFANDLP